MEKKTVLDSGIQYQPGYPTTLSHLSVILCLFPLLISPCVAGPNHIPAAPQTKHTVSIEAETIPSVIDRALEKTVAALKHAQHSEHGYWDPEFPAGSADIALSLLATNTVGLKGHASLREEMALIERLLAQEVPGGGFEYYPGSGRSSAADTIIILAIQAFLSNRGENLTSSNHTRIQNTLDRLQGDVSLAAAEEPWANHFLSSLLTRNINQLPLDILEIVLKGKPHWSQPVRAFEPAMIALLSSALDFSTASVRLGLEVAQARPGELVSLLVNQVSSDQVVNRIVSMQQPDGSWMFNSILTAFNVIALSSLDAERFHYSSAPLIKRGVNFIRNRRFGDDNGRVRQSILLGDIWSTAWSATSLLFTEGRLPHATKVADFFRQQQRPDGRWSFGSGADSVDNDDTALVGKAMIHLKLQTELNEHTAITNAVTELVRLQRDTGGWSAWDSSTPTAVKPDLFTSTLYDLEHPDVTADVLQTILAARWSGTFKPSDHVWLDRAIDKAVDYLRESQADNHLWWSRWMAGYLYAPALIAPSLRVRGLITEDWVQASRAALISARRGHESGWGESPRIDTNPTLGGSRIVTVSQTASALIAVLSTHPIDNVAGDETLASGFSYLAREILKGNPGFDYVYTVLPGANYYAAPNWTLNLVVQALTYYREALEIGVNAATCRFVLGHIPAELEPCHATADSATFLAKRYGETIPSY